MPWREGGRPETEEQLDRLRRMSDFAQGHDFWKPLPAEAASEVFSKPREADRPGTSNQPAPRRSPRIPSCAYSLRWPTVEASASRDSQPRSAELGEEPSRSQSISDRL